MSIPPFTIKEGVKTPSLPVGRKLTDTFPYHRQLTEYLLCIYYHDKMIHTIQNISFPKIYVPFVIYIGEYSCLLTVHFPSNIHLRIHYISTFENLISSVILYTTFFDLESIRQVKVFHINAFCKQTIAFDNYRPCM